MTRMSGKKKTLTYILGIFVLAAAFVLTSTPVSAATGWTVQGDAVKTKDGIQLTETVSSNQIGVYSKNVPINPKDGFTISFDYWMGDVYKRARGGIQFIMMDQPVPEYGVWDTSTYQNYYVVEFDTYDNYEGDIYIRQKKQEQAITYVSPEDYPFKSCDETWHHAEITYAKGLLNVTVDGSQKLVYTAEKGFFKSDNPIVEEKPKSRKNAAAELQQATAQVAAEIENSMEVEEEYDFPPVTILDQNAQDNYIEAGAELSSKS